MIMRSALELSSDEGRRIHKELQGLLEAAAVQQAASSVERRRPEASAEPTLCCRGTPSEHRVEVGAPSHRNGVGYGRKISPACSRFCGNRHARLAPDATRRELGPVAAIGHADSPTNPTVASVLGMIRMLDAARAWTPAGHGPSRKGSGRLLFRRSFAHPLTLSNTPRIPTPARGSKIFVLRVVRAELMMIPSSFNTSLFT